MAIDETRCKSCIWHNDETGDCEGSFANRGFLGESPFYKAHPELSSELLVGLGINDDDCIGMEYRPETQAVKEQDG